MEHSDLIKKLSCLDLEISRCIEELQAAIDFDDSFLFSVKYSIYLSLLNEWKRSSKIYNSPLPDIAAYNSNILSGT